MKKIRVYIDTSVIGGCFDNEFKIYSNDLFKHFYQNNYIPVISETVIEELENAQMKVKDKIKSLDNLEILENNIEIKTLAKKYLDENIVSGKFFDDALHISSATIYKIDVLVSWNFKHIVNLNKIRLFNSVNLKEGYGILEIRTPMELLNE